MEFWKEWNMEISEKSFLQVGILYDKGEFLNDIHLDGKLQYCIDNRKSF